MKTDPRTVWKIVRHAYFNAHGKRDMSAIACRARLHARIRQCEDEGVVALYSWGRDCDGTEGEAMRPLRTDCPRHIERRVDDIYEGAEGPTTVRILPPEELDNFRARHRDAALEAFEDGHPHCLVGGAPQY